MPTRCSPIWSTASDERPAPGLASGGPGGVWAAAGLRGTPPAPRLAAVAADAGACAGEAEQLAQPVAIYAEPRPGLARLAELADGRFVYRCERRGEWLAVMFPAPGEAVDCSVRSAREACAIGWIQGDLETMVMG